VTSYHRDILIDTRTSCSKDEAVAILLGRRSYDPIYRDLHPDGDPEQRDQEFTDWLDLSIFEELVDDRDGILCELDEATENHDLSRIEACQKRIVQCDDTIRRAKLILCDIDDELAKGAASTLRSVSVQIPDPFNTTPITLGDLVNELAKGATSKMRPVSTHVAEISGTTQITISSLKQWAKGRDYLTAPLDAAPMQPVPPAPDVDADDEPLLTAKGGMTPKSAKSFLVTFYILLEQFVAVTKKDYVDESGTGMNKQAIINLLWEKSLPDARHGHFLPDQSIASIKKRLTKVIEKSASLTALQRAKARRSKTASTKS
jgi:hypothetical protein